MDKIKIKRGIALLFVMITAFMIVDAINDPAAFVNGFIDGFL